MTEVGQARVFARQGQLKPGFDAFCSGRAGSRNSKSGSTKDGMAFQGVLDFT